MSVEKGKKEFSDLTDHDKRILNRVVVSAFQERCETLLSMHSNLDKMGSIIGYGIQMCEVSREILNLDNIVNWLGEYSPGYSSDSREIIDRYGSDQNLHRIIEAHCGSE